MSTLMYPKWNKISINHEKIQIVTAKPINQYLDEQNAPSIHQASMQKIGRPIHEPTGQPNDQANDKPTRPSIK